MWAHTVLLCTSAIILLLLSAVKSSINGTVPVVLAVIRACAVTKALPCLTDEVLLWLLCCFSSTLSSSHHFYSGWFLYITLLHNSTSSRCTSLQSWPLCICLCSFATCFRSSWVLIMTKSLDSWWRKNVRPLVEEHYWLLLLQSGKKDDLFLVFLYASALSTMLQYTVLCAFRTIENSKNIK